MPIINRAEDNGADVKRKGYALVLLLVLLAGMLSGCAAEEKKRYQITFLDLFDTVTTVLGYEASEEDFRKRTDQVYSLLAEYDRLYDIYEEYPGLVNLCTVNRHPGETVAVDPRIMDLLLLAEEVYDFSGGRTDATLGSVLRLWHEARETGMEHPGQAALPDAESLAEAALHTGFDRIAIDPAAGTVTILDPAASLDVGALAKGYAVQKACEILPEGYLISAGGNVAATGPKPDGSSWTVGIQDPDNLSGYVKKVALKKGAVVTSGDYQRYYTVDGVKYHHIIDPETLMPGNRWRSVTVIMEDSGLADAMSTTLFLADQETGSALAEKLGAEVLWIPSEGDMISTSGFEQYMIE